MAKKKKRSRNAASSVMSLITDEAPSPPPIPKTIVAPKSKPKPKAKPKPKPASRRKATCGVCGNSDQMIAYSDSDDKWEDKGHPDHFNREVCVECVSDYQSRDACAVLVYDAMRKQLRTKEFSEHDIDQAVRIARRTFNVAFDHSALVKMARKMKVKHPWLKGKKTK